MKSNAKRLLVSLAVAGACLAGALGVYVYPRRAVPSLFSLVPGEDMIGATRLINLRDLWAGCSRTAFARRVREGDIFPVRELRASSKEFSEKWRDLDVSRLPDVLGADCLLVAYSGGRGLRAGAWSRIGAKVRFFHLWARTRAIFSPARRRELAVKRIGGLAVNVVTDRKSGIARFSYLLIGDLGIAAPGFERDFWERIRGLYEDRGGGEPSPIEGALADLKRPAGALAAGAFYIEAGRVSDFLGRRLAALGARGRRLKGSIEEVRRILLPAAKAMAQATGRFSLGEHSRADIDFGPLAGAPEGKRRDPRLDPLAALLGDGGIMYAGGRCDLASLIRRARSAGGERKIRIEFYREGRRSVFPASHFSLDWLGDDCSLLLVRGAGGLVEAALSFSLKDRALAAARISRFIRLARGARIRVVDGAGKTIVRSKGRIAVGMKRLAPGLPYCLIDTGGVPARLYVPAVGLSSNRLIVTTSEGLMKRALGRKKAAPIEWAEPGEAQFALRGREAERAAASTRRMLALIGVFAGKPRERRRIGAASNMLAFAEWLAPLEEAAGAAGRRGDKVHVTIGAEFRDTEEEPLR